MERARAHLWISGRVQGVAYRASAAREAARQGVRGWVRNLPDGRVEAVAEGPADGVEAFIEWCRRGPTAARVDAVEIDRETPTGEFRRFDVTG